MKQYPNHMRSMSTLITATRGVGLAASAICIGFPAVAQGWQLQPIATFVGTASVPHAPWGNSTIALMGDLNSDNVREVAYSTLGVAEILDGATGASLGAWNYPGPVGIAAVSDVDGDGVADLMLGAPYVNVVGGRSGVIDLLSGATRAVSRLRSGSFDSYFGMSICRIEDVDGDGLDDVVCGANHDSLGGGWGSGSCYQVSSASGHQLSSNSGTGYFGSAVTVGPDVTGDGIQDFIVTRGYNSPAAGYFRVYSGASGTLHWQSASTEIRYGAQHDFVPDISGDGVPDIIVAGDTSVTACSGVDGAIIYQVPLLRPQPGLGLVHLRDCSDVLGVPAVALGWPDSSVAGPQNGSLTFLNAANGALMHTLHGAIAGGRLGSAILADEDWDGDGQTDLAVASLGYVSPSVNVARIDVLTAVSIIASATTYGAGCGTPALDLSPTSNPIFGTTAGAMIANAPTSLAGVMMGWSDTALAGLLLLPLPLGFIGMPGCSLIQSNEVFGLPATPVTASTLQFEYAIPTQASLLGEHVYLQAYCFAPGANAAQVIASNGIDWLIGNQ
ncbi:MAG: hypothetical protein ACJAUC_003549 [Planctomycetota bacterium]|jgi:hypothetical protein